MRTELGLGGNVKDVIQQAADLLGIDKKGEDDATWKEIVLVREWGVLHVFNLLSHGRRVFRQQVYSSRSAFCLAGLDPMLDPQPATATRTATWLL